MLTILIFGKDANGRWKLASGQSDYPTKRRLMAELGNCGGGLHLAEDVQELIDYFALKYPHITLRFNA